MPASIVCAALVAMSFAGTEHPGCASGGSGADEVASDIEAEVSLPDPNRDALLRYLFRPVLNRCPFVKSIVRFTSWFQLTISVTSLNTLNGYR